MDDTTGKNTSIAPDGKPEAEQPLWRSVFPIDWVKEHYVARRSFIRLLVLASLGLMLGQFLFIILNSYRRKKKRYPIKPIAKVDEIGVGEAKAFAYPQEDNPCLLVRLSETNFVAYGQKCTHLSCAIIPDVTANLFVCPCHNGKFRLDSGAPAGGPPTRPLPRVLLERRGGMIYATGMEVRHL